MPYSAYIQNANTFGGSYLYSSLLDNYLFAADKRFGITGTGFSMFVPAQIFSYNYGSPGLRVNQGGTGVVTIDLTAKGEVSAGGIVYPAGYLFVSYYNLAGPATFTARVMDKNGVWHACAGLVDVSYSGGTPVQRLTVPSNNYLTVLELTFAAAPATACWITGIDYVMTRPSGMPTSVVNKFGDNSHYGTLSLVDGNNVAQASVGTAGIMLRSPDGTQYRLKVANGGTLTVTAI